MLGCIVADRECCVGVTRRALNGVTLSRWREYKTLNRLKWHWLNGGWHEHKNETSSHNTFINGNGNTCKVSLTPFLLWGSKDQIIYWRKTFFSVILIWAQLYLYTFCLFGSAIFQMYREHPTNLWWFAKRYVTIEHGAHSAALGAITLMN